MGGLQQRQASQNPPTKWELEIALGKIGAERITENKGVNGERKKRITKTNNSIAMTETEAEPECWSCHMFGGSHITTH